MGLRSVTGVSPTQGEAHVPGPPLGHSRRSATVTGSAGCPAWSSAQSRSRASAETYSKKGSQGGGDELSRSLPCIGMSPLRHSTSLSTVRYMEPGQKCSQVQPILLLRANTGHAPPFPSISHIVAPTGNKSLGMKGQAGLPVRGREGPALCGMCTAWSL